MITTHIPRDWRELEQAVATVLDKCGLQIERAKVVSTVRGDVEVDVHAIQRAGNRNYTIFCECKCWTSRVPQTVVHAFRTVVQDGGAHAGYIISSAGFQSGAEKAAVSSNIHLVTWEEFQQEFEQDYFDNYFRQALANCVDKLCSYTEPISPATFLASGKLAEHKVDRFLDLKHRYEDFANECLRYFPFMRDFEPSGRLILPLSRSERTWNYLPPELANIEGYEEFLEEACELASRGLSEFRALLAA